MNLWGGELTKIELFAREQIDGWDYWGNELQEYEEPISEPEFKIIEKRWNEDGEIQNTNSQRECGANMLV